MLFDTDIFIWVQRGNTKAARLIEQEKQRLLSVQSYMELLLCAQDKQQLRFMKDFLIEFEFTVLPLTENIGHRASIYVEQFALSHSLRAGDAIVAATAVENNLRLVSSNAKHFKAIPDLEFRRFTA